MLNCLTESTWVEGNVTKVAEQEGMLDRSFKSKTIHEQMEHPVQSEHILVASSSAVARGRPSTVPRTPSAHQT